MLFCQCELIFFLLPYAQEYCFPCVGVVSCVASVSNPDSFGLGCTQICAWSSHSAPTILKGQHEGDEALVVEADGVGRALRVPRVFAGGDTL